MHATIRTLADYHNPQSVPVKLSPMAHHLRGLSWTASGYGARIPTEYMVQVNGKWRRVYCRIYSNIGTLFIGRRYDGTIVVRLDPDGKPVEPLPKLYPDRKRTRATRFLRGAAQRMHELDVNGNPVIKMGQILTCTETGKQFAAASDGFTCNYARDREGNLFSDEGVDIREKRDLLDRSKPFCCYLSSDGRHVTGWKGNIHGWVTWSSESRTGWHGSWLTHVRAIDVHGNSWHGKGAGSGMFIRLHPSKG